MSKAELKERFDRNTSVTTQNPLVINGAKKDELIITETPQTMTFFVKSRQICQDYD